MKKIPMWLGRRLVLLGKIREEDLKDPLLVQKELNVDLGVRALMEGYLSLEDFKFINAKQRQEAKTFAVVALEGGFLNCKQLEELNAINEERHVFLGDLLLKRNLVSQDDIKEAMEYDHFAEQLGCKPM